MFLGQLQHKSVQPVSKWLGLQSQTIIAQALPFSYRGAFSICPRAFALEGYARDYVDITWLPQAAADSLGRKRGLSTRDWLKLVD